MDEQLNNGNNSEKGQPDKAALNSLSDLPDQVKTILQNLPEEQKRATLELLIQQTTVTASRHSGPLPNPVSYAKYEQVLPGSADRILSMAERQSAHRIEMEKIAITRQFNQSGAGQWIACAVALILIGSGSFLVYQDHDTAGTTIITGTLVSLVYIFVKGKDAQKKDLENKR